MIQVHPIRHCNPGSRRKVGPQRCTVRPCDTGSRPRDTGPGDSPARPSCRHSRCLRRRGICVRRSASRRSRTEPGALRTARAASRLQPMKWRHRISHNEYYSRLEIMKQI